MDSFEEFMLLGIDSSETFEILYSGSKEDCYGEFEVAIRDDETRMNYMSLAVVQNLRKAHLDYEITEYATESKETFDKERGPIFDSLRSEAQPGC